MISPSLLLVLVLSYFIGAVPFAVLVSKQLRGVDVRRTGSGNTGAMNTLRSAGRTAGVVVALLDGAKAAAAMLLGRLLFDPQLAVLCGIAAVAGHCFSPYLMFAARNERGGGWKMALRRTGGKGLASGMAVMLLTDWRIAVICSLIFFGTLLIMRRDETWPAIIGVAFTTPLAWWLTRESATTLAVLLVSILVIIKHLPDVRQGFYVTMNHEQ